jgi:hypothetical protein
MDQNAQTLQTHIIEKGSLLKEKGPLLPDLIRDAKEYVLLCRENVVKGPMKEGLVHRKCSPKPSGEKPKMNPARNQCRFLEYHCHSFVDSIP